MTQAYENAAQARDFLQARLHRAPQAGVVLGSGLGSFAEELSDPQHIPYQEIPHWPVSGVAGHRGQWVAGELGGVTVAVLSGRAHLYEGYSPEQAVFGVRVLGLLGVRSLVLTSAVGAVNQSWRPGQLALIADHINLQGGSPLVGPNEDRFGLRFPDLSEPYAARYRERAREMAQELELEIVEGVYAAVRGPNYETPAEVRYLRASGADMVGMSVAQETIAARHLGMQVLGLAVVSNAAAGIGAEPLSHEEVLAAGRRAAPRLSAWLKALIPRLLQA